MQCAMGPYGGCRAAARAAARAEQAPDAESLAAAAVEAVAVAREAWTPLAMDALRCIAKVQQSRRSAGPSLSTLQAQAADAAAKAEQEASPQTGQR